MHIQVLNMDARLDLAQKKPIIALDKLLNSYSICERINANVPKAFTSYLLSKAYRDICDQEKSTQFYNKASETLGQINSPWSVDSLEEQMIIQFL